MKLAAVAFALPFWIGLGLAAYYGGLEGVARYLLFWAGLCLLGFGVGKIRQEA